MNLVLLPHHNTITSIQKLQKSCSDSTKNMADDMIFIPSYPLVCVLADGNGQIKLLKDMMKSTQGTLQFMQPGISSPGKSSGSESADTLIQPVQVPFMQLVKEAGFTPVDKPHIVLGSWYAICADKTAAADKTACADKAAAAFQASGASGLPAPSRSFQLALMQTTPLSKAGPAAAFSWKYTDAFWVKLR